MIDNQPESIHPSPSSPKAPALQRETMVMVNDRGRFGLLVALCSLAGVAVGFGLSNMASGMHGQHCSVRSAVAVARSQAPTWLGVRIKDHRAGQGAYVLSVEPDSPASRAGIQAGDVVTSFATDRGCSQASARVSTSSDLVYLVQSAAISEHVAVRVERNGAERTVHAVLEQMPLDIFYNTYGR